MSKAVRVPVEGAERLLPGLRGELEAGEQQALGVGAHLVDLAGAQVRVLGAGAAQTAEVAVPSLSEPARDSTIATAPEPSVSVANCSRNIVSSPCRRRGGRSSPPS